MPDEINLSFPQASVDLTDAQRFLDFLARGSACTFQVFDDGQAKRRGLNRILHGSLAVHSKTLMRLNEQGAGIFVMVNAGDGNGRKLSNVRAVRALFVDLDGAPLAPVLNGPIAPHMVTETSPGRWHAFWLVDGVRLESFSHLQEQLAKMFDADRSVKDLCRVMRVPGFVHNKQQPYRSRLVHLDDSPAIPVQEFVDAFGISPLIAVGERNTYLFKSTAGLKHGGIPKRRGS
ncbi:DNA-primase RepB domain-containing protein [Massilia cellulosiltytica]|uniref:DNA-primase RepB domain-containing protein n=1 Tax=Massilia cellulosiltytica TaxID=2683234 RepID=UPI0039B38E5F